MTDTKNTKELSDKDLDQVSGGFIGLEQEGIKSAGKPSEKSVQSTASGNPEGFTKTGGGNDI